MHKWSFLTSHTIVFGEIVKQAGESTFREISSASDISYRASREAIGDLDKDGYIIRKRKGKEFRYSVNPEFPLNPKINRNNFFMVHLLQIAKKPPAERPEFWEYARNKYPNELDEDLITMIEDLIERRRAKKYGGKNRSQTDSDRRGRPEFDA